MGVASTPTSRHWKHVTSSQLINKKWVFGGVSWMRLERCGVSLDKEAEVEQQFWVGVCGAL
jgi:hypothetical protein